MALRLFASLLLLVSIGCDRLPLALSPSPPNAPEPGETETAVQQRLWSPRMLARGGAVGSCEVDQVLRPALGCAESVQFFAGGMNSTPKGALRIKAERPAVLETDYGLVEALVKVPELAKWVPMAPFAVAPGIHPINRQVQHPRARSKRHQTILHVRPMISAMTRWRMRPVWPVPSSELTFDLAILPDAITAGARSARVRVFAQVAPEPRKLIFEKVIDNKEPTGWQSQSISLTDFAGRPTSFSFEAQPWPPAQGGFSAPLIGAPMLTYRATSTAEPRNVLLISLDTLRGDHVGAKRNGRDLTPNLDALAAQGAVFRQAMTTYPSTTASHMSLMTGLYPIAHNTDHPGVTLSQEIPMLAELLSEQGFATAAVTENAMLSAASGFARGFDFYREERDLGLSVAQGQIEKTFAAGSAWMEQHKDERFFLFLHTYQVHGPYRPPPEYDVFKSDLTNTPKGSLSRRAITQINAYAGEVLYTDAMVGRLLAKIDELGLAENTIIIITSDHGEEFGMHGHIGHSQIPYESVMRVPLLIRAPGKFKPGIKIDRPVSLVDILPTVLAMVDSPPTKRVRGKRPWHGVSLVGLLKGTSEPQREAVFAESRRPGFKSVVARTDTHRFITFADPEATPGIYDLRNDRAEQDNLVAPDMRARGRTLTQRYETWRNDTPQQAAPAAKRDTVDPETAAKLRALGYTD